MSISGSGFNVNFNPTPSIFERETRGNVDLQKKADIGQGNVVILPQAQQDMIPFTKLNDRNIWNYKSESDRPTLQPAGQLRSGGPESREAEAKWSTIFNEWFDDLPEDLKALIKDNPSLATGAFIVTYELGAKGLEWLANTARVANSENALNRTEANKLFPEYFFRSSHTGGKELAEHMERLLEEIGPNDPNYMEAKEKLTAFKSLMKEIK